MARPMHERGRDWQRKVVQAWRVWRLPSLWVGARSSLEVLGLSPPTRETRSAPLCVYRQTGEAPFVRSFPLSQYYAIHPHPPPPPPPSSSSSLGSGAGWLCCSFPGCPMPLRPTAGQADITSTSGCCKHFYSFVRQLCSKLCFSIDTRVVTVRFSPYCCSPEPTFSAN